MSATIEAMTAYELLELFENFKKRHAYINVLDRYEANGKYYIEVEFCG